MSFAATILADRIRARWRSEVWLARKGDTLEYVRRMQKELFDVLTKVEEACDPLQGKRDELFEKIWKSFSGKGLSEARVALFLGRRSDVSWWMRLGER